MTINLTLIKQKNYFLQKTNGKLLAQEFKTLEEVHNFIKNTKGMFRLIIQ